MGREVILPATLPQRIVSLVPSQTELLYDLGLGDRVVGITKFCVHPADWRKQKTIVGGTKQFRFEVIDDLAPDLIIGNKEENYREGIEALAKKYPVWMSDIATLTDALEMIESVSDLCGEAEQGIAMAREIRQGMEAVDKTNQGTAVYLIWRQPYMAAGSGTFIHEVLQQAGFQNQVLDDRYPELSVSALEALSPDHVLLSSEPFPFKAKHIAELKEVLPNAQVRLVDGEMFSWYGSHMLQLPAYLNQLRQDLLLSE